MLKKIRETSFRRNGITTPYSNTKSLMKSYPISSSSWQQHTTSTSSPHLLSSSFTNNSSAYHRNMNMTPSMISFCGSPMTQYNYTSHDISVGAPVMNVVGPLQLKQTLSNHTMSPVHSYESNHYRHEAGRCNGQEQSLSVPHSHYLQHIQCHPSQPPHAQHQPHFIGGFQDERSYTSAPTLHQGYSSYFVGHAAAPIRHYTNVNMSGGETEVRGQHKSHYMPTPTHMMYSNQNQSEQRNTRQHTVCGQVPFSTFIRYANNSPVHLSDATVLARDERPSDGAPKPMYMGNSPADMSQNQFLMGQENHDFNEGAHRQQQAYYRLSNQRFRSTGECFPFFAKTGHRFSNAPHGSSPSLSLLSSSVFQLHPLSVSKINEILAYLHSLGFSIRVCTSLWRSYKRSFWELLPFTLALLFLIPEGMNRAFAEEVKARIEERYLEKNNENR